MIRRRTALGTTPRGCYLNLLLQVQLAPFHPSGALQAKPAIAALESRSLEFGGGDLPSWRLPRFGAQICVIQLMNTLGDMMMDKILVWWSLLVNSKRCNWLGEVRGQTTWQAHNEFDAGTIRSCEGPVGRVVEMMQQRRTQQKQSERMIRNDKQNIWKDREECKRKLDAGYEVQIKGESEQSRTKKHQRKAAD